jgi:hypothetical protein
MIMGIKLIFVVLVLYHDLGMGWVREWNEGVLGDSPLLYKEDSTIN